RKTHPAMPGQEKGTKMSCAVNYELYVQQRRHKDNIELLFEASDKLFGSKALGAGFNVYDTSSDAHFFRSYAVAAGDSLSAIWPKNSHYGLHVYGPNGFLRTFEGDADEPDLLVECHYRKDGNILLKLLNYGDKDVSIE